MKYLKPYKLFEELANVGDISDKLNDDFKSEIIDMCLELNDIYPIEVSFDNSYWRKHNLYRGHYQNGELVTDDRRIWSSDYPSITITRNLDESRSSFNFRKFDITSDLPFKTGKGSGQFNKRLIRDWNLECLSVANRIKSYLNANDNVWSTFKLFTVIDKGDERSFDLNNSITPESLGPFPRLDNKTLRQGDIRKFRIIFNPYWALSE